MECIRAKLNCQRGASILIALMLFLVCAMVGCVVLNAAASNLTKIQKREAEQQAYLAVMSAAQLVQEELSDRVYTATKTEMEYTCDDESVEDAHSDWSGSFSGSIGDSENILKRFLEYGAQTIANSRNAAIYSASYLIHSGNLSGGTDYDVTVDLTMYGSYMVKAVVSIKQGSFAGAYSMTVTADANYVKNSEVTTGECTHKYVDTETVTTLKVDWGAASIHKEG